MSVPPQCRISQADGKIQWSHGGLGTGSLMMAGDKLIVLGEYGKLVIAEASPDDYKELASAQILEGKCWTMPVLANGRIYARNAEGRLVCLDVRKEKDSEAQEESVAESIVGG